MWKRVGAAPSFTEAVKHRDKLAVVWKSRRFSTMGMWIGRNRKARVTYGFDDIALVPGTVTINPNEVDTSFQLGSHKIRVPILASAMDGVVDVRFAIEMGKLGGVAVLNLEGVQTRYKHPGEVIEKIVNASKEEATHILQRTYTVPIQEDLIAARVNEIKEARGPGA